MLLLRRKFAANSGRSRNDASAASTYLDEDRKSLFISLVMKNVHFFEAKRNLTKLIKRRNMRERKSLYSQWGKGVNGTPERIIPFSLEYTRAHT